MIEIKKTHTHHSKINNFFAFLRIQKYLGQYLNTIFRKIF